jgi:membrane protease YdiL (CAAX protease family)
VPSLYIPWDFVLILLILAVVVPWRGHVRMKRLLKSDLTSADRLSLYASTILFQWLIVAIVLSRCLARDVAFEELGVTVGDRWQVAWVSFGLTGFFCIVQFLGLRKITRLPEDQRGATFAITEKIMPRDPVETLVFAALACTAGISEEFLYRGFVFAALVRMIVNYGSPLAASAILSSAMFALAHYYQGRKGIITTFVVGMAFATIRIWTGSLVPVVVAHIGIDLVAGLSVPRFLLKGQRADA